MNIPIKRLLLEGTLQTMIDNNKSKFMYFSNKLKYINDKEYKCSYNPTEAIRHIIVNGVCDYKSNQFYPTPENIVDDIVEYVGL